MFGEIICRPFHFVNLFLYRFLYRTREICLYGLIGRWNCDFIRYLFGYPCLYGVAPTFQGYLPGKPKAENKMERMVGIVLVEERMPFRRREGLRLIYVMSSVTNRTEFYKISWHLQENMKNKTP